MIIDGYTLRECPFCGKDVATITTAKELEDCTRFEDAQCPALVWEECRYKKIVCDVREGGCGASTGFAFSLEKVVQKWNGRAYEDTDKK